MANANLTPSQTAIPAAASAHIPWADLATANQTIGTAFSVAGKWSVTFNVKFGRRSGSAFTAGWPNVRIEASGNSSGNSDWITLTSYQMQLGSSIANTTLNGAIAAGATSCVVTSATNIAAGDYLFLGHTTLTTNYELVRVKSVSGTTVTFEEACTFAHDNSAPVTDQAESVSMTFSVESFQRMRAVLDNVGSGQTIAAQVQVCTFDNVQINPAT